MPTNEELQKQLVQDLLAESNEGLDRFDREMLALEKGEGSPDTPNIIFRVIHTIKGTAGCLGLAKIESVAHVGENLLSLLRDGRITVTPPLISALLAYADALRAMLACLRDQGHEGGEDYSALLKQLQELQDAPPSAATETAILSAAPQEAAAPQGWGLFDDEPAAAPAAPASPARANPSTASPAPAPAPAGGDAGTKAAQGDTAIRVNVDQLDRLMNLVGELVLARNQIVQHSSQLEDNALIAASQRLNIITTELQENVMKTRMQPIGNVWTKFPRIVRDIAGELGKKVQLVMEGNKTELDRTIIEAIKDPLTHIIRNAIDHGIETPAARRDAGKPDEGMLILRAFHEGGQVNIEIMDDGRGIHVARVKEKALQRALISADQAARMSDREAFGLIFLPGFSTAEKVTNISGRGVGMDVVKTNIEKIGGSVDLLSEAGAGTTIKIKIPLTLAIIPALIVTTARERFAIPQVSLLELVRLEPGQARQGIETLYGAPVHRLRGQLLPLVYLNKELELDPDVRASDGAVNIVVLQADGRQFGLVVDDINDTEEIVVKPLGKQLKGLACFAGATIMGDGRVALILDVLGLAQHAHVIGEVRDRTVSEKNRGETRASERQTLLLFDVGRGGRMAVPLSMVARLEEFPRSQVERSGSHRVVQYRGQILPLVRVADYVRGGGEEPRGTEPDLMQVVVYSEQGRSIGLVVDSINDIVEEAITVRRESAGDGILGSAVVQNKVTDLLDVPSIIRSADPAFYSSGRPPVGLAA